VPLAPSASIPTGPLDTFLDSLRTAARDVEELLEDPRPAGQAIFARQRPMSEVREYDVNGFRRVPSGVLP